MHKAEFARALSSHEAAGKQMATGERTLTRFFAEYFNQLDIPSDRKYDWWDIIPYLPQLLLGACETFRTAPAESQIGRLRASYEDEMGRPFPDLSKLGFGNQIDEVLTVGSIAYLVTVATGVEGLRDEITRLFLAENTLLQQTFFTFCDRVLRQGLFKVIDNATRAGMSGSFGETTLRSFTIAGRLMFTFARPGAEMEHSVSFICEDGNPLGLGGGLQTCYASLQTALSMIWDVINHWPSDEAAQAEIFKANKKVSI